MPQVVQLSLLFGGGENTVPASKLVLLSAIDEM